MEHPLATLGSHRDIETRQLRCRLGRCRQCLPRIFRVDQLGAGWGLLRLALGSKAKQGWWAWRDRDALQSRLSLEQPFQEWRYSEAGSDLVSPPERAGCLVDAAPALWRLRWSGVLELAIHLCEAGVAGAADRHPSAARWVCERPFCDN
jgi:hypothetical protein